MSRNYEEVGGSAVFAHVVWRVLPSGAAAYLDIVERVPFHRDGCIAAGTVFCLEEQLVSPEVRQSTQCRVMLLPGQNAHQPFLS